MFLLILLVIAVSLFLWVFRYYVLSLYEYLLVRFERKKIDFQLLSSLRDDLVHERKKKVAGLEMILSSWERGDEIQPRYEYLEELLNQLKNLIREGRRNLKAVTKDIFLWGKLWHMLRRIEKTCRKKRERVGIRELRNELNQIQNLIDQEVESATVQFSFTLNQVVSESVKIVRIEKSHIKNIQIYEQLDDVGNAIRFSYNKFKDWQRILTNLIRNAIEAVEAKHARDGVAADFSLRGRDENVVADLGLPGGAERYWVKISTQLSVSNSVSVCIEDSGIGMDEITRSSFYKKGFTFGKEGGLGLGVSEESVQFINQYGSWQIESQKGVGTKITIKIDQEKAQKDQLILPKEKPFFRTKLGYAFSFLLLAVIGLASLFIFDKYSRFWVDWNTAYAKVEQGRQVFVFNSEEKELWMHEFERIVCIRKESPQVESPLIKIEDLDQDRWNEILIAIEAGPQVPGQLFCFDHKGNVRWAFSGGQSFEIDTSDKENKPDIFAIKNFLVDDFTNSGNKEIIVLSQLHALYPTQLALLDHQGKTIGEYWHPGGLPFLVHTDLDGDGEKELFCAGINNRLNWRTVVFTLDVKELIGNKLQGPPYNIFSNLKPAKEKKYMVLPQIKEVVWDWVQVSPYETPQQTVIRPDGIFLMLPDSRHYFLTKDLQYNSCAVSNGWFANWQKKTTFPFELDLEKDSLNWKNFEVYENGVRVK
jgi:signal transduction histidine kinase